jgi:hypothetical protein
VQHTKSLISVCDKFEIISILALDNRVLIKCLRFNSEVHNLDELEK